MTLQIEWDNLERPGEYADALLHELDKLKHRFYEIGWDTKLPEYKRRFWEKVPAHSVISKSFVSDEPTWKAGVVMNPPTEMERLNPHIKWTATGRMILLFSPPSYEQTYSVNQSPLEYVLFGKPRTFKGRDDVRSEACVRVLGDALYSLGLHPGGPTPPDRWNWNLLP